MKTQNRLARAFKLYQKLHDKMIQIELRRPSGRHGIAINYDPPALEWQKLSFRAHRLECYITGEPINWFNAKWLSIEEIQRRMGE